jgi:hypothetical protein
MRDGVLAYRQVSVMFDVLVRWVVCTGSARSAGRPGSGAADGHRRLTTTAPQMRSVALPGCGHLPQFEWPEATGALID